MLHVLEVDGLGQSAGAQVVKEYVRAGAGHLVPAAYDLRPRDVLLHTIQYLIRYVQLPTLLCVCMYVCKYM